MMSLEVLTMISTTSITHNAHLLSLAMNPIVHNCIHLSGFSELVAELRIVQALSGSPNERSWNLGISICELGDQHLQFYQRRSYP